MAKLIADGHISCPRFGRMDTYKLRNPIGSNFRGFGVLRAWHRANTPDVNIIVYNDHATEFSLDSYSTFTIGVAETFELRMRVSPRQVPSMSGHPDLAWHIVESAMAEEFDLAVHASMDLDHGFTVPL